MINPLFYKSIAEEMISKVRRLNNFVKNPWAIGYHHEAILKETLKSLLPDRFTFKTGFVFADGEASSQVDIIIVDETKVNSYFFKEGDLVIVHPDAVVCGIEVKTTLDINGFKEAIENISSLKTLYKKGYSRKRNTGGFVFSFEGPNFSSDDGNKLCGEWWKSISERDYLLYPQMIFVLTRGRFDLRTDKKDQWGHYYIMDEEGDLKVNSLSVFLSSIKYYCSHDEKNTDLFKYANFGGLHYSKKYFKFGVGELIE